jgi:alpha-tubulin suppressor-like RCC1 family protein
VLRGAQSGTATNLQNIVQISTRGYHTVFLENTGQVLACGANSAGQLGDNRNSSPQVDKYVPVYVLRGAQSGTSTNLQNIVQISAGSSHTVFLENTGQVLACGRNDAGQLGDNRNPSPQVDKYVPVYVLTLLQSASENLQNIVQISGGSSYTVFLENTGKVLACGTNVYGILGDNRNPSPQINKYIPVYSLTSYNSNLNIVNYVYTLPFAANVVVTSSYNNIIFVNNSDNAVCIGYNYNNMFGNLLANNTFIDISSSGSLTNVINVAVGISHCILLLKNNTAYGVGNNFYGQLGTNDARKRYRPTLVSGANNSSIINIKCGENYSIFLKTNNTAFGCGLNTSGQLGVGNTVNQTVMTIVTGSLSISNAECGANHTIFLTTTYKIYTCGLNTFGQLGNGTNTNRSSPTAILTTFEFDLIDCGKNHTIVVTRDRLNIYTFGNNNLGQLFVPITTTSTFTPQNFVLTKKIIYIYSNAFLDKTYILTNNVTQISLLDLILLYQY